MDQCVNISQISFWNIPPIPRKVPQKAPLSVSPSIPLPPLDPHRSFYSLELRGLLWQTWTPGSVLRGGPVLGVAPVLCRQQSPPSQEPLPSAWHRFQSCLS